MKKKRSKNNSKQKSIPTTREFEFFEKETSAHSKNKCDSKELLKMKK